MVCAISVEAGALNEASIVRFDLKCVKRKFCTHLIRFAHAYEYAHLSWPDAVDRRPRADVGRTKAAQFRLGCREASRFAIHRFAIRSTSRGRRWLRAIRPFA